MHYSASNGTLNEAPKFIVDEKVLADKEVKYRAIVYYNTLFNISPIIGNQSSNITLYTTDPTLLDQSFSHIKQLNQHFIIINKAAATVRYLNPLPGIQQDLLLNIKPELYNRNIVSESSVAISTEEI
jgi:hypothetical protein